MSTVFRKSSPKQDQKQDQNYLSMKKTIENQWLKFLWRA